MENFKFWKKETGAKEMYEKSTDSALDEHSLLRYEKNKESDLLIKEWANNSLNKTAREISKKSDLEKKDFIENILKNKDISIQKKYMENLPILNIFQEYELGKTIEENIKNNLVSSDVLRQKIAADMIKYSNDPAPLIEIGLQNNNSEIQEISANTIYFLNDDSNLRSLVLEKVKSGLLNENKIDKRSYIRMIRWIPDDQKLSLVEEGIKKGDTELLKEYLSVSDSIPREEREELEEKIFFMFEKALNDGEKQKLFSRLIGYMPNNRLEIEKIFNLAVKKGFTNELVESSIYDKVNLNEKDFSRSDFEKTGSSTTLLGGDLKNKLIIRKIDPEAFLSWQKVFENWKVWQEAGFDYIPVEPIVSYYPDKDNEVRVYSTLLDIDLRDWFKKTDMFAEDLYKQREKILEVIEKKLKIKHGHEDVLGNYCLKFYKDKEGNVDFGKTPRLYLIDFDQAYSIDENEK